MAQNIFRKKSFERISSPEQLNDYIRVASPPVWMLLGAVLLLLIGFCVWGVFGQLETVIPGVAIVEDGAVTVYVKEESDSAEEGMTVRINDNEFTISSVSDLPMAVSEDIPEYALHVGNLKLGEWVYEVKADNSAAQDLYPADGIYSANIVAESVSPISFVVD